MKKPILVVEDDRAIASFVRKVLEDNDFVSEHAKDADRALEYLKSTTPRLMILDLDLPGLSGTQLCEIIRKDPKLAPLPILMLTVLGGEKQRIRGLQAGADDYLAKPFAPQELVERIKAILRRVERPEGGAPLSAQGIEVDLDRHEVKVGGKLATLRPKEYEILVALMRRPGRVMSPQALVETVWGLDAAVTKHTVSEHIKNLRKALGKGGDAIETVLEAGYKFRDAAR